MPRTSVNGVDLYFEEAGSGEPVVLVHGSWGDHTIWQGVASVLSTSFRVVSYDRRGHSGSRQSAAAGSGTRRDDEDDLVALIDGLGRGPVHVVGNSFGGSIAIGLAARRPDLFRSVSVHEPPLLALVSDDPEAAPQIHAVGEGVRAVLQLLDSGQIEEGTRHFVEDVALGPGAWEHVPQEMRDTMVNNAATFVEEQRDPDWASVSLGELADLGRPVLLTHGEYSPAWFSTIIRKLAQAVPGADVRLVPGAGHIPQATHPAEFAALLSEFIRRSTRS